MALPQTDNKGDRSGRSNNLSQQTPVPKGLQPKFKLLLIVSAVSVVLAVGGILLLKTVQFGQDPVQTEFRDPHEPEIIQAQLQQQVTEFLKLNINNYVQAEPVLGAPKFFADEVEFYPGNKFIATFEDGHILGYMLGTYSAGEGGIHIQYLAETFNNTGEPSLEDLKIQYDFVEGADTSAWQTYRSDEFGFELQYPQELDSEKDTWILSPTSNTTGIRFKLPTQEEGEAAYPYIFMVCPDGGCVVVHGEERCTIFPETSYTEKEVAGVLFQRGAWEEEFLEPGRTWLKVEYMGKRGGICYDFIYQATQQEPREQIDTHIRQFEDIISTFQFVEKEEISAANCKDPWPEGNPTITSIFPTSGPVGTEVEIRGCHLTGFEGDLDAIFVRSDDVAIPLFGGVWCAWCEHEMQSQDVYMKVTVGSYCESGYEWGRYSGIETPCEKVEATPGVYKVYVGAWTEKSNEVTFTITE